MAQLEDLLKDPSANKAKILALEQQLNTLVSSNPSSFNKLIQTDVHNFCVQIEDYYMVPSPSPEELGSVMAWFDNIKTDLSNMPNILSPLQDQNRIAKDLYNISYYLMQSPPDLKAVQQALEDLEASGYQTLPAAYRDKIQQAIDGAEKCLKDPSAENIGFAAGSAQSAYYAVYIQWQN